MGGKVRIYRVNHYDKNRKLHFGTGERITAGRSTLGRVQITAIDFKPVAGKTYKLTDKYKMSKGRRYYIIKKT